MVVIGLQLLVDKLLQQNNKLLVTVIFRLRVNTTQYFSGAFQITYGFMTGGK